MGVKMVYNMNDIKKALGKDNIQWSGHILTRMQQRGIKINDIINSLSNGCIIEYYEDDYPYPSCLVLVLTDDDRYIHVVCALAEDSIWMITAYYPAISEWLDDFRTRRR